MEINTLHKLDKFVERLDELIKEFRWSHFFYELDSSEIDKDIKKRLNKSFSDLEDAYFAFAAQQKHAWKEFIKEATNDNG
jgi:predicted transcriptional regulator